MAKHHLSRKELKENELEDALLGARDFVSSHKDQTRRYTLIGAAVVAVVALVWGALSLRSRSLSAELSKALATYDAPLASDGLPPVEGRPVFKDAAERQKAAVEAMRKLAGSSSSAGKAAAVVVLAADGKAGVSGTNVDRVASFVKAESGSMAAGFAAVSLLEARAAAGQVKEAIETGKRYLEASRPPVPKDVLIFTLARLYEKAGQPAEAKGFYQRVVTDFPDSPVRAEAQQRVSGL
jgi:tetratricopeptide (TPR) repeat protein